jgi:hypothetical protein
MNGRLAVVATMVIAAAGITLSATPARAGILDGSLNNADIIDHISLLNSNINSDPQYTENRNAKTRATGREHLCPRRGHRRRDGPVHRAR